MANEEEVAAAAFKARLQKARDQRKLSQQDLAKKTGLPPSSISHFESGDRRPSFDNLRRLADALNVSTDFLIGRTAETGSASHATPVAEGIHRNLNKLTAYDLDIASQFIEVLAKKNSGRSDG